MDLYVGEVLGDKLIIRSRIRQIPGFGYADLDGTRHVIESLTSGVTLLFPYRNTLQGSLGTESCIDSEKYILRVQVKTRVTRPPINTFKGGFENRRVLLMTLLFHSLTTVRGGNEVRLSNVLLFR